MDLTDTIEVNSLLKLEIDKIKNNKQTTKNKKRTIKDPHYPYIFSPHNLYNIIPNIRNQNKKDR